MYAHAQRRSISSSESYTQSRYRHVLIKSIDITRKTSSSSTSSSSSSSSSARSTPVTTTAQHENNNSNNCNAINILNWIESISEENESLQKKISIEENERGVRGIKSKIELEPGEVILAVPWRFCFKDVVSWEAEANEGEDAAVTWSTRMGVRVLEEKARARESLFHEWILSLPREHPWTPGISCASEDEIVELVRYRRCVEEAVALKRKHEESKAILKERLDKIGCTGADLDWAAALMESRCFKHGGLRCTAPGIDMCNHAGDLANCIVRFVKDAKGETKMKLQVSPDRFKAIEAGEELTISYGYQSNDIYFSYFGFVPNDNENDTALLFDTDDELASFIYESADEIGLNDTCKDIALVKSIIFEATKNSNRDKSFSLGTRGKIEKHLSDCLLALKLTNEQIASVVQKRCFEILTKGPFVGTTLKNDLELAEAYPGQGIGICAAYRVSKKNIYAFPLNKKKER